MKPKRELLLAGSPAVLPAGALVAMPARVAPGGLATPVPSVHDIAVVDADLRQRAMVHFSGVDVREILAGLPGRYRKRILPVTLLVMLMLLFVLGRVPSFRALWERLTKGLLPGVPLVEVSESALYKRLHTVSHEVFLELLRNTTRSLATSPLRRTWVADLVPFAQRVLAIDDTTLDALARKTAWLKAFEKGAPETLGGRLGCALDLTTGRFAEVLYDPDSAANEKTHFWPLIERLGVAAMYVFDLGYFSFPIFDGLTERFCYFVSRLRAKISFVVLQTFAENSHYRDRIVYLGKHRADRAAYPVRMVELLIGTTWYCYVTNVLDPVMLPADRLWALYAQRWSIEMCFAAVKRSLNMAFLRLSHPNGVLIQIWSTLIVFQVLVHLRFEIAAQNNWREDEISWMRLMRRIGWYLERPDTRRDLRQWILEESPTLMLEKRGVRKRRATSLPTIVEKQIAASKPPPIDSTLVPRAARQGKPRPPNRRAPITQGRLS